jgi:hypothetical protein
MTFVMGGLPSPRVRSAITSSGFVVIWAGGVPEGGSGC